MGEKRQRGMTGLGWLIVLALIAFFALLAIRLVPVYMEAFNVKGSLKSLQEEPFITQKSRIEIIQLLERRFDINDIEAVDPRKHVKIQKDGGRLNVAADYEIRRNIAGNIDVVIAFHNEVEIVRN